MSRLLVRLTSYLILPMVSSIGATSSADGPSATSAVMRVTNDRDADLIDALIDRGRFDEAETICRDEMSKAVATSDVFARWTVRGVRVATRRLLNSDDFDEGSIRQAIEPITDLLDRYPDHSRRVFLEAAELEVRAAAARHDVVVATIRPPGNDRETRAIKRIAGLVSDCRALIDRVDDRRSLLASRGAAVDAQANPATPADLIRLGQELNVMLVSIQLIQSELFAAGSPDCVATATSARAAADLAIARLPARSGARREIERLRVSAVLRGGDHRRAKQELDRMTKSNDDPRIRATRIQIHLAAGETDLAKERMDEYYGGSPISAPASIEMDLVRLSYLMANNDPGVEDWLDAIGRRDGEYARRRAEAVSLRQLRSGVSSHAMTPALVAAQGKSWLQRGDPRRAATLLAAAAHAEGDHDKALQYAQQSAAVMMSTDQVSEACDLLIELSVEKSDAKSAPAVHLHAAVLITKHFVADGASRVESLLRETIRNWPNSEPADQARDWLSNLLRSQQRWIEAAESLSYPDADRGQFYRAWKAAFHDAEGESVADVGQHFMRATKSLMQDESWSTELRRHAVIFLDTGMLEEFRRVPGDSSDPLDRFIDALAEFRVGGKVTPALSEPDDGRLADDARWRLRQDGLADPSRQRVIGRVIASWNPEEADSLDRAIELFWNDEIDRSFAMIRRLVNGSKRPGSKLRSAAELLSRMGNPVAEEHAVTLWDELASGLPKHSAEWHQAKLAAIKLLWKMNRTDDARRRARYLLLTSPPKDDSVRVRYEEFAGPSQ